jgi:hypothetical protein
MLFLFVRRASRSSLFGRYGDVLKALDMEDKELRRTLQSLACAHPKQLIKSPKGRDVEPDDTFAYNPKFDCKQLRIKVRAAESHFARALYKCVVQRYLRMSSWQTLRTCSGNSIVSKGLFPPAM